MDTGNVLGDYILMRTLGAGSFSKVKQAIHRPTGLKVAIKILNRKKLKAMDMDLKVRREINILRVLKHPHIIELYEVIDTPSDIFVVMEYVEGGELFDYIVTHGRLQENDARRFFQQIVSGIEYLHENRVVHRDLKPENLLLDKKNRIRIADFGLSNLIYDGNFLKTSCGSPNYAAPEVISGQLYVGPEVDVWSCGVILYALLCGSLPFDDENIPNLFRRIKIGKYTLPPHLSKQAADLIPKMLTVNPVDRITVDQIRKHPFFQSARMPKYLQLSTEDYKQLTTSIDENTVTKVCENLGCRVEEVHEALSHGVDLLTRRRYRSGKYSRQRKISVCYTLLKKDYFQMGLDSQNDVFSNVLNAPIEVTSPADQLLMHQNWLDKIASMSTIIRYTFEKYPVHWLIGIWTSLEPTDMIRHVLKCLQQVEMEWIFTSKYCVRARTNEKENEEPIVELVLQLYSATKNLSHYASSQKPGFDPLGGRHLKRDGKRQHKFMLDCRRTKGSVLSFMDLCANFISFVTA